MHLKDIPKPSWVVKRKKQAVWYSDHQEGKLKDESSGFVPGEIFWWGEARGAKYS